MTSGILQYGELAKYYDQLYEWKDYAKETHALSRLIRQYKVSAGNSLLDVGCGTGKHIQHLRRKFDCVGIDASEQMLEQARRNVKGVEFIRADMTSFNLERKFDVVLCLFSSIGYVRTYSNLASTLRNFSNHLKDGGVAIIEPWFTKSAWKNGSVHLRTFNTDELKIARVGFSRTRGTISLLDERLIVAEKDKGISYFKDLQLLGLFERAKFLELMEKAGLRPKFIRKSLAPGRGLYVGVRERRE